MPSPIKRVLILCKTYPSPSTRYVETSCVAGMDEEGKLLRLFPVPFRLIRDEQQFRKWQWIRARVEKASNDHRPESHKIYIDTIECDPEPLSTRDGWSERRFWLEKVQLFSDFAELEAARRGSGQTLGFLVPARVIGLDIAPCATPDWTDEELKKLVREQQQGGLFDASAENRELRTLRKLPFDFHYRYECRTESGTAQYRHKLVDWEIGALFWNTRRSHGPRWEEPFRARVERELPAKDLMFLMGTIHRFPDKWLIVSVLYPPRPSLGQGSQGWLFPPTSA